MTGVELVLLWLVLLCGFYAAWNDAEPKVTHSPRKAY